MNKVIKYSSGKAYATPEGLPISEQDELKDGQTVLIVDTYPHTTLVLLKVDEISYKKTIGSQAAIAGILLHNMSDPSFAEAVLTAARLYKTNQQ